MQNARKTKRSQVSYDGMSAIAPRTSCPGIYWRQTIALLAFSDQCKFSKAAATAVMAVCMLGCSHMQNQTPILQVMQDKPRASE